MTKKTILYLFIVAILIISIGTYCVFSRLTFDSRLSPTGTTNENYLSADLDWFYTQPAVHGYPDVRTLPPNYSKEQAQFDQCFVIGAMVHNDYLYADFMAKYARGETAFIRVVQNTIEGDLIVHDLLFDPTLNKVLLVTDNTRDRFINTGQAHGIWLEEYEHIGETTIDGHEYWLVYDGELPTDLSRDDLTDLPARVLVIIN